MVAASNDQGEGPASAESNAVTPMGEQVITDFTADPANPVYAAGGNFTVSATGGASGNPVNFSIDAASSTVCSAGGTNGESIGILSAGTCRVLADQAGSAAWLPAPQAALDVTIAPGNADLQLAKDANRSYALIGDTVVYAIVATNAGPVDAAAATLSDIPPGTLADVEWACVPAASSLPCPGAPDDAGIGPLEVSIALPAGEHLRYDLSATIAGVVGETIENTASLTLDDDNATDPAQANNSATASVLVVDVFADGFEAAPPPFEVPAAEPARERD